MGDEKLASSNGEAAALRGMKSARRTSTVVDHPLLHPRIGANSKNCRATLFMRRTLTPLPPKSPFSHSNVYSNIRLVMSSSFHELPFRTFTVEASAQVVCMISSSLFCSDISNCRGWNLPSMGLWRGELFACRRVYPRSKRKFSWRPGEVHVLGELEPGLFGFRNAPTNG